MFRFEFMAFYVASTEPNVFSAPRCVRTFERNLLKTMKARRVVKLRPVKFQGTQQLLRPFLFAKAVRSLAQRWITRNSGKLGLIYDQSQSSRFSHLNQNI
jgi:hypothetical protein